MIINSFIWRYDANTQSDVMNVRWWRSENATLKATMRNETVKFILITSYKIMTILKEFADMRWAWHRLKVAVLNGLWITRLCKYLTSAEFHHLVHVRIRRSIMQFFAFKVWKHKEWDQLPRWLKIIKYILYPTYSYYDNWQWLNYDVTTDQYIIEWMKIDWCFFREWLKPWLIFKFSEDKKQIRYLTVWDMVDELKDALWTADLLDKRE